MKIIVAGTGYVGLVHAAVSSEFGHEVYAYDNNPDKVRAFASCEADQIVRYVNEPGLADIISKVHDRHLFFSTELDDIIEGTDAIFCACRRPRTGTDPPT
jgi:UDPglucose 6-dehydrogenase